MTGPKTNERPGTRASVRHARGSASKARRVLDLVRNQPIDEARAILQFSETGVSNTIAKVLNSAVANAGHNDGIPEEELFVSACYADEGPTMKRWRPRARGRATRIRKRTAHITVIVSRFEEDELERRRAELSARGGTSAAQAEARRRRVARSRGDDEAETTETEATEEAVEETAEQKAAAVIAATDAAAGGADGGVSISDDDGDDLTEISGIGPVFAGKLAEAGVASFGALAALDDETKEQIADDLDVGDKIDDWIEQAKTRAEEND